MTDKVIMKLRSNSALSTVRGKIIEVPFGIGIKSIMVLSSTGSGVTPTATLTGSISEYDWSIPTVNELAVNLNYGSGSAIITHSFSGSQPLPAYDVKDWVETATGSPRILSPTLAIQWVPSVGTWTFRHYLVVEK